MAEASVGSRKRSAAEGTLGSGAEGLFTFPRPGPGNSEGPVDSDPWPLHSGDDPFGRDSGPSLATSPRQGL